MEHIGWLIAVVIIFLVFLRMRATDNNLDTPIATWTDAELQRRLARYEAVRTAAGRIAIQGNLDAVNRCAIAGAKVKEIQEEIEKRSGQK